MHMASNASAAVVEAALLFLVRSATKPKVLMPATAAGRIERTGTYEPVPVLIHDARGQAVAPNLDLEGFALVHAPTAVRDFQDAAVVERLYYPEVIDLLQQSTGAKEVRVFDHTVRMQDAADAAAPGIRPPVAYVHNDYTENSARRRMREFFAPHEAVRLEGGRFAFVNVWRSIGASAEAFPLAAADGRSVPQADYVAVDMVYADRIGEIYHTAYSPGQRWFYFAGMRCDEVMLLKCFDSAVDGRTRYTAHTGFGNPSAAPGTPPRRSIEVRTILTFDA